MIHKLIGLFVRAKLIIRNEGIVALIGRGFSFIKRHIYFSETYYLYEHSARERDESAYMPRTQDFTLKIVSSNREVDELAAEGYDLRYWYPVYSERLDRGAVAFCLFIGREMAHIGWVGMNDAAKDSIGEVPYKVNYANNEAFTGGTWTDPKYRGLGLSTYVYLKRFDYLRERGKSIVRAAAATDNTPSNRMHAKFGPKIVATGHYLKLLWWESWKEKPMAD